MKKEWKKDGKGPVKDGDSDVSLCTGCSLAVHNMDNGARETRILAQHVDFSNEALCRAMAEEEGGRDKVSSGDEEIDEVLSEIEGSESLDLGD